MPGAQFWEVRSLPAVFAAVNVEQKRLRQHGFPTLYRRRVSMIPCVRLSTGAGCGMGDGVSLGWKRLPEAGTQSWLWDSISGTQVGALD